MTMRLRTLLGDHPCTAALKRRIDQVRSGRVRFRRLLADPQGLQADGAGAGFRRLGDGDRHLSDGEEFWQADGAVAERGGGAIPARLCGLSSRSSAMLKPADLNGKRVGIRSFTTTTGAWLRGILANDYGVDLNSIDWVTFEDAHVAEFRGHHQAGAGGQGDHPDAARRRTRCGAGREGRSSRLEAAVSGPRAGRESWFAKHGMVPINHMVVVSRNCPTTIPDAVREVHRMLSESAAQDAAGAVQRRRNAPFADR